MSKRFITFRNLLDTNLYYEKRSIYMINSQVSLSGDKDANSIRAKNIDSSINNTECAYIFINGGVLNIKDSKRTLSTFFGLVPKKIAVSADTTVNIITENSRVKIYQK